MVDGNSAGSATLTPIRTRRVYGHLVVGLSGEVDSGTPQALRDSFAKLVGEEQHRMCGLIIDLTETELNDVSGLAALMKIYWKTTGLQSELRLVAPHGPAREAVLTAKLDCLAPLYPTVEHAATDDAETG